MSTTKPLTARQVEARSRARKLGIRVQVVTPGQHYLTRSQADATIAYRMAPPPAGPTNARGSCTPAAASFSDSLSAAVSVRAGRSARSRGSIQYQIQASGRRRASGAAAPWHC